MPDAAKPPPAGASGTTGDPGPGICAKLCVNTATFVIDNPLSADELFSGVLKACHNGDQECHTGALPARDMGGNTVTFAGASTWDGPSVWSPDDWRTIQYSWESVQPTALRDGDSFSLSLVSEGKQTLLFEQAVTFEIVHDCAGSCQSARYDLRTELGQGGIAATSEAGAGFGGAEAGSSGEGGAANH